jgi:hypothetical protein
MWWKILAGMVKGAAKGVGQQSKEFGHEQDQVDYLQNMTDHPEDAEGGDAPHGFRSGADAGKGFAKIGTDQAKSSSMGYASNESPLGHYAKASDFKARMSDHVPYMSGNGMDLDYSEQNPYGSAFVGGK